MKNNISYLEEYKRLLTIKKGLDEGSILLDELSLEDLDGINELYGEELKSIDMEIENKKANIEELKRENAYLKKLIRSGDN